MLFFFLWQSTFSFAHLITGSVINTTDTFSPSSLLFFILHHLSASRLQSRFGSFISAPFQPQPVRVHTHTYTQVHVSPSVYYLTPPGGRDSITELNSDPASTAWPEERNVVCVCERERDLVCVWFCGSTSVWFGGYDTSTHY